MYRHIVKKKNTVLYCAAGLPVRYCKFLQQLFYSVVGIVLEASCIDIANEISGYPSFCYALSNFSLSLRSWLDVYYLAEITETTTSIEALYASSIGPV